MRIKFIFPVFVLFLLLASALLLSPQAHTQQRELGLSQSTTAAGAGGGGGGYHALVIGNNAYQKVRRLETAEATRARWKRS